MSYVYYDVETRANERAREFYERFWTPPGNMSKPDTIAAAKAKQIETLEGSGLRWWTGAVCCICAETDDGTVFQCVDADEKILLTRFFDWCRELEGKYDVTYVGKSALEFDVPFLIGRALACSARLPYKFCDKANKSPLRDIDRIFGFSRSQTQQIGKLSDYAWGLALDPKSGHGSEVQGQWDRGEYDGIKTYCADDVRIVKEVAKRWKDCTE